MIGQLLAGRYKLIQPLGAGGMGQTYIAEDTQRPGHPVCVVKQLKPPSTDPQFLATAQRLFNKEAETLENLGSHSQIPTLLAYFEQDQDFFLVQELIKGHPLSQELPPGQCWSEPQVCQFLEEILQLLAFVHEQGVIHRDIKPDNIIRREADNQLVLIDFGAVKQVRSQQTVMAAPVSQSVAIGTPGYMPSEQVMGQPRPSSDLYAVGKIGIQALTGLLPVQLSEDEDGEVVWRSQLQVTDGLADFLSQMVRHYFKFRYQTATEALAALQQIQQTNLGVAPTDLSGQTTPMLVSHTLAQSPSPSTSSITDTHQTVAVSYSPNQSSEPSPSSRSQLPLIIGAGVIAGGLIAAAIVWRFSPPPQTVEPTQTASPIAGTVFDNDPGLDLLAQAKAKATGSGDLGAAIELVQGIDTDSGAYTEAQTLRQQWDAEWRDQKALFEQAKTSLAAGRWLEAKNAARALPENAYWEPQARPIYTQAEQALAAQNRPSPSPSSPSSSPTTSPTPSGNPTPPTASFPAGTFQDDTWQVALSEANETYSYQGRNLKTGDSLSLTGASVATNDRRQVYTWNNGGYLYQVAWRPQDPTIIRLQVFTPKGKRLINRLLRQGS